MTDLDIQLHPQLPCPRCGNELLFVVRVPVETERADGRSVTTHRTVTLCPHCHRDDQTARGVIAFFTVNPRITEATLHDAAPVLQQWLEHVAANPPTYTDDDMDADIRLWKDGEM